MNSIPEDKHSKRTSKQKTQQHRTKVIGQLVDSYVLRDQEDLKKNLLFYAKVSRRSKSHSALKTDEYFFSTENILHFNRRLISQEKIPSVLRLEFQDAQKHLNECIFDPSKWNDAKPENCKQPYIAKRIGRAGIAHMQGIRPTMEDTFIATVLNIRCASGIEELALYGIFDGHGGDACAAYLQSHLPNYLNIKLEAALVGCITKKQEDAALFNVLKLAFVDLGAEYRRTSAVHGGSTANIALIFKNYLWVANVGDTRSILAFHGKAIALSEDAKPALEKYKRGVESRHCVVVKINGIARVEGVLAIARAVGHSEITSGISPRAKVIRYPLKRVPKKDSFLIIACDGLWDVTSSNQVANTVDKISDKPPEEIAAYLIRKGYEAESSDNISALVISL